MTRIPKMTDTQLGAVRAYLMAQAHEGTMRSLIAPIQAEAIAIWKPLVARESRTDPAMQTAITTMDRLWLTDDATFQTICADIVAMTAKRHPHITVSRPGNCPLLEAEELTRIAGRAVVLAFQEWGPMAGKGVTHHSLLCAGLKVLREFIDLHVRLAVSLYPKKLTA